MRTELLAVLLLGATLNWVLADFSRFIMLGLRLRESFVLSSVCSLICTFLLSFYLFGLNMDSQARLPIILALYVVAFGISYRLPRLVVAYLDDLRSTPYLLHADIVRIFPFAVAATAIAVAGAL